MSNDNNRYKNGKIYTIRNINDNNLIYVGSTIQPLYKRFHDHKKKCMNENNKEYNKFLYKKIRETNNINDWYIELYENYPTETKELLLKREGEVIREIGTLNKKIEGRTKKEWHDLYDKKHYQENRDKILEQKKIYNINNKDKIQIKNQNFYKQNIEKIKIQTKEYYEKNQKIKIMCVCGCEVNKACIKRHQQSNKHNRLLKEQEQQENNIIE